jgi:hypothetical protein
MYINEKIECEFEVIFVDGYILRGKYDYVRKSKCRPSLRKHLEGICCEIILSECTRSTQGTTEAKFLDVYELGL